MLSRPFLSVFSSGSRIFLAILWVLALATPLRAQTDAEFIATQNIVSNASPADSAAIRAVLLKLQRSAENHDATALALFGAAPPADNAPLQISTATTHIAVTAQGALVRQNYSISIQRATPIVLASGAQDLWLARAVDGSFSLTQQRFADAPDALGEMLKNLARESRDALADEDVVVDLVASRVGGRWISLRSQRWQGRLRDEENAQNPLGAREFLQQRMDSAPFGRALTGHFFLQKGENGWFGVNAAFNSAKRLSAASDTGATQWRSRINSGAYLRAESHRDFSLALTASGLWNEAADEAQKAELLRPNIIGAARLKVANTNRARDPQFLVAAQLKNEGNVGLGAEHPTYLINALLTEQRAQPNVLNALRISLEYSRLADDARAQSWLQTASDLQARGAVRRGDKAWVQLLVDHLRERARLSPLKPSNILRSPLFTVRLWPDEPNAATHLAALEEAQHTVYADFGIPMGNTEVLLWHNQSEFSKYTTQFSEQGGSEFVAALTLTKLVSTLNGPMVLGEEVNTFADKRDLSALFGTVAHEYGHVAVRQLSKGRMVPVWFNEGIATSVEGGYDGYIRRVRDGANNGTLLSMREMLEWNVDGERAFMAYSQANSLIDYLVNTTGKEAVLEVLRQIGRDVPPEQAFQRVLGFGQNELWNRWARDGIQ